MNAHVPRGWQPVCIEREDGGFKYLMPSGRWLVKKLVNGEWVTDVEER